MMHHALMMIFIIHHLMTDEHKASAWVMNTSLITEAERGNLSRPIYVVFVKDPEAVSHDDENRGRKPKPPYTILAFCDEETISMKDHR